MGLFDGLDSVSASRDKIIRSPFGYPGGKSRSLKYILPELPMTRCYVEPFGGSAAVLLARQPSPVEVFNDRYAGVVAFYRCLRDEDLYQNLIDRLELTIHAREEFSWCKETWSNVDDPVERAARWYYLVQTSFGGLCRNWGRQTGKKANMPGKVQRRLPEFPAIHARFKHVQVENQDWLQCVRDYDAPDTVFYFDPPYVDADPGIYKHGIDHRQMMEVIPTLKGFVALSGYPNPLFETSFWDERKQWDAFISIKSAAYVDNNKEHLKGIETRGHNTEVLWIKESSD